MKGAIFDVDGTMLDSLAIWMNAAPIYLTQMNIKPDKDIVEIMWSMSLPEGAEYLKKRYEISQTSEEILQGVLAVVRDFYFYEAMPKEGVAELLKRFKDKNIKMAIATSSNKEHIEVAMKRLGLRDYFEVICTCEEAGAGKTKPDVYSMAAKAIGTLPEETYIFEDSLFAIKTAKKAGYRVVGVYDSFSEKEQEEIKEYSDIYCINLEDFSEV